MHSSKPFPLLAPSAGPLAAVEIPPGTFEGGEIEPGVFH